MATILLIDDDAQFRNMLAQMLSGDDHEVLLAINGAQGVQIAAQQSIDLIITDILMPQLDGIDTIMALRKRGHTVPIIAISGGRRAITADFNLESAQLIGVNATLAKPFSRSELRLTLKSLLD